MRDNDNGGPEFCAWFKAKHGRRPKFHGVPDRKLSAVILRGNLAAWTREAQRLWDNRRFSSLLAWRAAKKDKS